MSRFRISVIGSPHTRRPNDPAPSAAPMDVVAWHQLRTCSSGALRLMGCLPWDEPDERGRVLMLLPGEWFAHIPPGFELESIDGSVHPFKADWSDDIRFGCLAYGIRVKS